MTGFGNRPTAEPPPPPPGEPSHGSSVTDENAISEEDLFRLFVEPNADYFVKMRRAKADKKKFIWSFNWVVLLAFLPWFYYRKLYFIGTGIMLLPVIILLVFPDMSSIPGMTAMTLFLPMFVNLLYVEIAIRRVAKIVALGLSPEQRDERLRRAGGVSRLGATIGILIFLVSNGLAIFAAYIEIKSENLPACESAEMRDLTSTLVLDSLSSQGIYHGDVMILDLSPVSTEDDGTRNLCQFSVVAGGENLIFYASVSWADRTIAQYQVRIGRTHDSVLK